MTKRITTAVIASLALLSGAVAPLAARQSSSPTPPVVALSTPTIVKKQRPPMDRYKGRVVSFNLAQMIVQNVENEKMMWTFQYAVQLKPHVLDLLNAGGYQYGDRVEVFCSPGTTVAVRIKGRPSKPI
ncbi:MAG TPA: hypothetical protein VKG84_06925 [Candidatus Acidoferrales bacterium]|nr:hypothetical protein [Candidatus Acidoferrales bacterium]